MHDHDQGPDPEIPEYTPDVQKLEVGAVERVWPLEEPQEPLVGRGAMTVNGTSKL